MLSLWPGIVWENTLRWCVPVRLIFLMQFVRSGKRGEFMQAAVPVGTGTMAAIIGLAREEVEALCQQVTSDENIVTLANINSPGQFVISGHTNAVK